MRNQLLLLVIRSMPEEMRIKITDTVASTYPSDWMSLRLEKRSFMVEYFCYWNRYCERVIAFFSHSLSPLVSFTLYLSSRGNLLLREYTLIG